MPSKARQLADDIRGAVASLPSHLDPLCQAIAAKGGPKPPSGLLHYSMSVTPQLAHDENACTQQLLLYRAHTCLLKYHLLCSVYPLKQQPFVHAGMFSPSQTSGLSCSAALPCNK